MKTISIRQPWAWAILNAGKDVENRTLNIAGKYRGPVLIHAGKEPDDDAGFEACAELGGGPAVLKAAIFSKLMRTGGIVGVAMLTGVVSTSESPWFFGEFGLVLEHARALPFAPAKGSLGLFEIETEELPEATRKAIAEWMDEFSTTTKGREDEWITKR